MIEPRLTEIETKLAFAEDMIDTLNQTVARQQAQIDSLQAQLRVVYQQVQNRRDTHAARRNAAALLSVPNHTAIFTTILRIMPLLTSGACASSGKNRQNDPAGVAIQLAGASLKKRISRAAL